MKKTLIALAVASAAASPALAEAPLTVYGVVDLGFVHDSDNVTGGGNRTGLDSGIQAGSRLGFRGTEDLGGGLSAIFTLEMGFAADTGAMTQGATFGRQAFLGLQSGWGRLTLGRQYTPYYLALSEVADPFGGGLAGNAGNLMWDTGTRMNNAIIYTLPQWGGLNAELGYGFGETQGDHQAGRNYSGSVGYTAGPFAVKLAHHGATDATASVRSRSTLLAGTYDLKVARIHLGVADNDDIADSEGRLREAHSRDWLAGIRLPFRRSNFILSYIRKDDRTASNQDAAQWAVGYTYELSKRTDFYTSYGQMTNKNGAAYTIGNAMNLGLGQRQFNVGIRHLF